MNEIEFATNNFHHKNVLENGGYGGFIDTFKGIGPHETPWAVSRENVVSEESRAKFLEGVNFLTTTL